MRKWLVGAIVLAAIAVAPASASATCGTGPGQPWYSGGYTAVNGYANCSGDTVQIEVCMQQNWGAGWYNMDQTCRTTSYQYVTWTLVATTASTPAYCGRWYRADQYDYINGRGAWQTGYANYRC